MKTLGQLTRYGIVGIASNGVLYIIYLALTGAGVGHKLAATIAYGLGVLQAFLLNKAWTFKNHDTLGPSFYRYLAAYVLGYVINIAGLIALADSGGYPHQLAQGIMILVVASFLFAAQKWWVFSPRRGAPNAT